MAQQLKILNSKEIKRIHEQLNEQFGFTGKLPYAFLLQEKKEKIFLFSKDLARFPTEKVRIDAMGVQFGTFFEGQLRLTIEGAQLIGKECSRNVFQVTKPQMQAWMQGEKLARADVAGSDALEHGVFVMLKHGDDLLGCGKVSGEWITNYIPKARYVHALYD